MPQKTYAQRIAQIVGTSGHGYADATAGLVDEQGPELIKDLLDFHRRHFGGTVMEAGDDGDGGSGDGDGEGGDGDQSGKDGGGDDGGEKFDFPDKTPLDAMTSEQKAEYWRHKARKHEQREKAFGNLTPQELATLRDKAKRADDLERDLMSDQEKAVADARADAEAKVRAEMMPQLVQGELKAEAVANGVTAETLADATEFADLTRFLDDDGNIDAGKIEKFVGGLAKKDDDQQQRRGPSGAGLGGHGSKPTPGIDSGKSAYLQRHGKKTA